MIILPGRAGANWVTGYGRIAEGLKLPKSEGNVENARRSGDPSLDREEGYLREQANAITGWQFSRVVFHPYAALVSKELVEGQHMWRPYAGGECDEDMFELVDGMWDHEHCSVCSFKITDDHAYWENASRIVLLCDECHEFYARK